MADSWTVIVIGAGAAGFNAALSAREHSPDATVLLIDQEEYNPYKRTKLSKHIAQGFQSEEFELQESSWYTEHEITLKTGCTIVAVDRSARELTDSDGNRYGYQSLILAPGADPLYPAVVRKHEEGSFYVVRNKKDAQRLTRDARKARNVLVAGMGVLAVEVAWQLVQMKKKVTLAGATPQIMPRQLDARAAEIMEDLLIKRGVKLMFQEEILSFERNKKGGMDVAMIKHSGVYDLVVFCIGIKPRVDLARQAGLEVNVGIVVDEHLRTSDEHIFSAGDAAEHEGGRLTYLWHAAEYQGKLAGENAVGGNAVFDDPPYRLKAEVFDSYFFSINKPENLLECELEEVEEGDMYVGLYYRDDTLCGVVMANDRDRAKLYQQAVREGWDRDKVNKEFFS